MPKTGLVRLSIRLRQTSKRPQGRAEANAYRRDEAWPGWMAQPHRSPTWQQAARSHATARPGRSGGAHLAGRPSAPELSYRLNAVLISGSLCHLQVFYFGLSEIYHLN